MKILDLKQLIREEISNLVKEEAYDLLVNTLKQMNPDEFTELITKVGDLDKWKSGGSVGIDGINNIDDRIETINQNFEEEDVRKYLNALNLN